MTVQADLRNTPERYFPRPSYQHVSLGTILRLVLFVVPSVLLIVILLGLMSARVLSPFMTAVFCAVFLFCWAIFVPGIRVAAQWERGVILRLGRFQSVRGPGVFYVVPMFEYARFVDIRTLVVNIPRQKVITRDNVPAEIDGALFFMVEDPGKSVILIQDYVIATAQYAQAALRDVVGSLTLDELLSEREQIQRRIKLHVEEQVKKWGIHVDSIQLQDIELPEDLKRMMSRQASAEREKRATITKSEGDKLAAENLSQAAVVMQTSPGAMQLRTLQTIDGLGASPSNTIVLFPAEISDLFKSRDVQAVLGATKKLDQQEN